MKLAPSPQALRILRHLARSQGSLANGPAPFLRASTRYFHATTRLDRTETHTLSDIGEGVKEVQIIQWFVEEGAPIEEWSPLCEVQSDKASVEITSKFSGVIKKIHFAQDAVVQVGDGMVDIEVEGEEEETPAEQESGEQLQQDPGKTADEEQNLEGDRTSKAAGDTSANIEEPKTPSKHASLATPAVRGLLKEHSISIEDITGTGKEGRVLKEDVYKYIEQGRSSATPSTTTSSSTSSPAPKPELTAQQTETAQRLTPIQSAMFKTMTSSLSIPHFLYADSADITKLASMRTRLNASRATDSTTPKLSYLPFIVKAVSLALNQYPLLNARLDAPSSSSTDADRPTPPQLMHRSLHNIGIAIDTPSGLVVPVVKAVNACSISSIAHEIARLAALGQAGKLSTSDLSGGTITVSNIGAIGGEVVAPVIVEGQLAILGIGAVRNVPVFADDEGVAVKRAQMVSLSWSADHRVVDGATMARMAKTVQAYLEEPGRMVVEMS